MILMIVIFNSKRTSLVSDKQVKISSCVEDDVEVLTNQQAIFINLFKITDYILNSLSMKKGQE